MFQTAIITAHYNNSKYIDEYLDGIVRQTIKPHFVSIYDDGSGDEHIRLINNTLHLWAKTEAVDINDPVFEKQFNIRGIQFIFAGEGKNRGPAAARNSAIAKLKNRANILFVCDSDDVYYPDKIRRSLDIFKKYPHTGLVYSDYETFNEVTAEIKKEFKEPFSYKRLWQECIVSNNSAFLLEAYNRVGKYDESLFGPEDYDLWLRISEAYATYHIPISLYKYRISGNNLTITTPKNKFAAHVHRVHQKKMQRQGQNEQNR